MRKFGAFEGVFVPTLLSILGVILFLRLGWVVGQVGLIDALLIILLSNAITFITALSLTSIVSNKRIGSGGAYSIISRSLGLEAGGAIGISLYLAQAISIAFYINGFSELWLSVFPGGNQLLVALIVWTVLFFVSQRSARLAFHLQYLILFVISLALGSIFSAFPGWEKIGQSGALRQEHFWHVFAVFFPAVTGVLAGVNMSGELKEPEKTIPVGTLSAIGVSFLVYCVVALWFSSVAPAQELVQDSSVAVKYARYPQLVIAGIMGATLSSALSMFVSSPRVLLALAKHRLVPGSRWIGLSSSSEEPRIAIAITAGISLIGLFVSLNSLAVLLTMIFLITYGSINFSVFVEQAIGIVSFRPSIRIPLFLPIIGFLGTLVSMILIDPLFAFISIFLLAGFYIYLVRRDFSQGWSGVRKGVLMFLAEQCLRLAKSLPDNPKIWKPNIILPVNEEALKRVSSLIPPLLAPNGRLVLLTKEGRDCEAAESFCSYVRGQGLWSTSLCLGLDRLEETIYICNQMCLPVNILLMDLGVQDFKKRIQDWYRLAIRHSMGFIGCLPYVGKDIRRVNLWIREGSPNLHLSILVALHLSRSQEVEISLIQVVSDGSKIRGYNYLVKLKELMRLPSDTKIEVKEGDFWEVLKDPPKSDLNIFGLPDTDEFPEEWFDSLHVLQTWIMVIKDSRRESARV